MRRVAKMRISHTAAVGSGPPLPIPVRHSQGPPFPGSAIPGVRLTLTLTLTTIARAPHSRGPPFPGSAIPGDRLTLTQGPGVPDPGSGGNGGPR